jgi:hypothetical protein
MWKGLNNDADSIGIGSGSLDATTAGAIRNIAYGRYTGRYITSGLGNCLFGFAAGGNSLIIGNYNTFFGTQCGQLAAGDANLGFGYTSCYHLNTAAASYNCALGYQSMRAKPSTVNTNTAAYNVALGYQTLYDITTGVYNVGVGFETLKLINNGNHNVAIGPRAGAQVSGGSKNILIGSGSGENITAGNNNTIIGSYLGGGSLTSTIVLADGLGNIQLWATGSRVALSGSLSVGTIGTSTTVGRIDASNDIVAFSTSDIRFKENIQPIENALYKVNQISGNTFDWKSDPELTILHGFKGKDVGVIAQEIEAILPEIVTTKDSGYKGVKYEKIVPLLIEAIKELTNKVNNLEEQLKTK